MLCVEFAQVQYIGFKWVNSCFESCLCCDWWTVKLIVDVCGQSLFDCQGVPWMEVKLSTRNPKKVSLSPEERSPITRGNKFVHKHCVNIFLGPNFVFPKWRYPLNRGVPKEKFHCTKEYSNQFKNK